MLNNIQQEFLQLIKQGQNPQQLMLHFLQTRFGNSPLYSLAVQKDSKAMETFARNYCKQKGIDFDKEFANFKKTIGGQH